MEKDTASPLLPHFGMWARFAAIEMRLNAIEPLKWTTEEQANFERAKALEVPSDLAKALEAMESKWKASEYSILLAEEVSRWVALTAPNRWGSYDLHSPLGQSVLKAPGSLAGTSFEIKSAPMRAETWRFDEQGEPLIELWSPYRSKDAELHPFAGASSKKGDFIEWKLSQLVDKHFRRLVGPAQVVIEVLQAHHRMEMTRTFMAQKPTVPLEWMDSMPKHLKHLVRLRSMVAVLPEGLDGLDELRGALGEPASSQVPHASLGWMWAMAPQTGMVWDAASAESLCQAAERAAARLKKSKQRAMPSVQESTQFYEAQTVCDAALISVWAWAGKAPDRESRKGLLEALWGNEGEGESERMERRFRHAYGQDFYDEFNPPALGPEREVPGPSAREDRTAPGMLNPRGQLQYDGYTLKKVVTHAGRITDVWTQEAMDAVRAVRSGIRGAKNRDPFPGKVQSWGRQVCQKTVDLALELASKREAKWCQDHGLDRAYGRLQDGGGGSITLADLDQENARKNIQKNHSKLSQLGAALEAAATSKEVRGGEAKSKALTLLASLGLGERALADFSQTSQCQAFLAMSHHFLELEAQRSLQNTKESGIKKAGVDDKKKSIKVLVEPFENRGSKTLWSLTIALMAYVRDVSNPDPSGWYQDPKEAARTLAEKIEAAQNEPRPESMEKPKDPGLAETDGLEWFKVIPAWLKYESEHWTQNGIAHKLIQQYDRPAEVYQWLHDRAGEFSQQAAMVCKYSVDEVMRRPSAEPEPQRATVMDPFNPESMTLLKERPLPDPFNPQLAYRWHYDLTSWYQAIDALPKELCDELDRHGFAGKMAQLAFQAHRSPVWNESNVSRLSEVNGWLAEGKKAARDWLGLSSGGWKIAMKVSPEQSESMLALAAKRAEAERLNVHNVQEPLPVLSIRNRYESTSSGNSSWDKRLDAGRDESLRKGFLQSNLMMKAASRGLGAEETTMALSALQTWETNMMKPTGRDYERSCLSCMSLGVSAPEALNNVVRELKSQSEKKDYFYHALLERAGGLKSKYHAQAALECAQLPLEKKAQAYGEATQKAAHALCDEVQEITDWGKSLNGRFWTSLPEKFNWNDLVRGSRLWHEAQIMKEAESGAAWPAVSVDFKQAPEGWECVELTTPTELTSEGKSMHHCVGSYAEQCRKGVSRIFSIRHHGARISTLELRPPKGSADEVGALHPVEEAWVLHQHKALSNQVPPPQAIEVAELFVNALSADWKKQAKMESKVPKNVAKKWESDFQQRTRDFLNRSASELDAPRHEPKPRHH